MSRTLRRTRPTEFLACLCLLRIYTALDYSRISDTLALNFPEYSRLRSGLIRQLYDDVQELHPGWVRTMHSADRYSDEIQQMLALVRSGGLSRRDRFPRDTRNTEAMIAYLEDLMNTPEVEVQRVEGTVGGRMVERAQWVEGVEVDQDYLDALPPELREEVLMQQRAIRLQSPSTAQGSTEISREFLDALPPDIRDEVLQQRAM